MRQIVPIVEGPGDAAALPHLIHRILDHLGLAGIQVLRPVYQKQGKDKLLEQGVLEHYVERALERAKGDARVLLLIDADGDCAVEQGLELRERLTRIAPESAAVLAVRKYENWLLADASALGRDGNFRDRINPPGNPEEVRNAKRWLSDRRTDGRSYRPTADQARLTELVDLETVRERCPSFRKLWREVERLAR